MFWKRKSQKDSQQEKSEPAGIGLEAGSINAIVLTDVGNTRANNEDAYLFVRNTNKANGHEEEYLLMVADGMGGHLAGEVASNLAVETIKQEYFKKPGNKKVEDRLFKAFHIANQRILQKASSDKHLQGMGTTCTAMVIIGNAVYYAHAGDSRAYFFKNGSVTRITEDHTYVQQLLNNGEISAQEAASHPNRNILTNAMGTNPELRVDTGRCTFLLEASDRLLLCSDGLYDYLSDLELAEMLKSSRSLQEIASDMIAMAKKRGGHDNITVVLAEQTDAKSITKLQDTEDYKVPITQENDLL